MSKTGEGRGHGSKNAAGMSMGEVARPWPDGKSRGFEGLRRGGPSARRSLFGPIDHDENNAYVQSELERVKEQDRQRWNFDFEKEKPLKGRYAWSSAECPKDEVAGASTDASPSPEKTEKPRKRASEGGVAHPEDSGQRQITDMFRKRKSTLIQKSSSLTLEPSNSEGKVQRRAST